MGYRDSDDSGFSRHGMNRDNNEHHTHDPLQHQRSQRVGFDHPDLDRDEDLRTSHSVALDHRSGRNEAYGGRRDGQGYLGPRAWEGRDTGRDRYQGQGQGGGYRNHDTGHGYGARSPDIGGYDPYESEQRFRQQQYGGGTYGGYGGGGYGPDDRARLWSREGYGGYGRDQGNNYGDHGSRQGRSYGYGYDGRPDGGYGHDDRQDAHGASYQDHQQGSNSTAHGYYRGGSQRHDPDYAAWRQEQLRLLDEDYDSWRNERYQKFSEEFNTWRSSRSRNEGLRGSNQSGQVTQSASAGGGSKGQQSGGTTGTAGTGGGPGSTSASGKTKD